MTCRSIVSSASAAGYTTDLFTTRFVPDAITHPIVHTSLPPIARFVPFSLVRGFASRRLHDLFLRTMREGEIAYLWPSVPLEIYRTLKRRGFRVVAEAVNTRMAEAKPLLDAAYDAVGIKPQHGITEERIVEQAERYQLADAIFTPSPGTETALVGTPLAQRFIPSSYGTWVPRDPPVRRRKSPDETVTFLFVGTICVRKGIPDLLAAWKGMPANARLRLVGMIEPGFSERFGHILAAPNISVATYTRNVQQEYLGADVFVLPSLEEGDSIVSYEAAAHALPVLASRVGAGRIGADSDAIDIVDTAHRDQFHARLVDYAMSPDLRARRGAAARSAVLAYDWSLVGPRSYAALHRFLASQS